MSEKNEDLGVIFEHRARLVLSAAKLASAQPTSELGAAEYYRKLSEAKRDEEIVGFKAIK